MGDYNNFFNDLIEENINLKKEVELLDSKYLLIETLLNYRKENKLSQNDFAKLIGVKQQAISRFEKGEVDPRLTFVSKVLLGMKKRISIINKEYINANQKLKVIKLREKASLSKKLNYNKFDTAI